MKTKPIRQNFFKKILKNCLKIGPRDDTTIKFPALNTHLIHNFGQKAIFRSPFGLFLAKKFSKKDYQDGLMPNFNISGTNNGRLINTKPAFSVKKTGQLPQNRHGNEVVNRPIGSIFNLLSPTAIFLKRSIFINYQNGSNNINWLSDFRNLCD